MGWFQLATAILGFAKELFKYLREQEENDKSCAIKIKGVTNDLKIASKSKDTDKLEQSFASLGLARPNTDGAK